MAMRDAEDKGIVLVEALAMMRMMMMTGHGPDVAAPEPSACPPPDADASILEQAHG